MRSVGRQRLIDLVGQYGPKATGLHTTKFSLTGGPIGSGVVYIMRRDGGNWNRAAETTWEALNDAALIGEEQFLNLMNHLLGKEAVTHGAKD